MSYAEDFFSDSELREILTLAEQRMRGAWEEEFISGLASKYDSYGCSMFMSEKQAAILKRIAGLQGGSEQRRQAHPPPPPPPPPPSSIDKQFLRQLTQLCHPDKHGQSALSVEVMQRLNRMRASL